MSSMPKLLATADWHVAHGAWRSHPSVVGDALHALSQIVDLALQQQVEAVLAAGDLYDTTSPDASEVRDVHSQLTRLQDANIPVYFIQGQHERRSRSPWLSVHAWPEHLHGQSVAIAGYKICGLDWTPGPDLAAAMAQVPACDLLMCHQVWEEFMGDFGAEGRLADVVCAPLVVTGDLHKSQVRSIPRGTGGPLTVVSPGSLCLQEISEPLPKGAYVLEAGQPTFQPIGSRYRELVTLSFPEELETLERDVDVLRDKLAEHVASHRLPPSLQAPLLRVTFRDDLPNVHARLHAWAATLGGVLFLKPQTVYASEVVIEEGYRRELAGQGLQAVLEVVHPADDRVRQDATRLLAEPVRSTLLAIRKEWLPEPTDDAVEDATTG